MSKRDLAERIQAFAAANRPKRGPACRACLLPGDVIDAIGGQRGAVEMTVLASFLKSEGHDVSAYTLGRHFREDHEQRGR